MMRVRVLGVTVVTAAVWGVATAASVGQSPSGDMSEYLPPGPGKDAVVTACAECHDLGRVASRRKTKEQWNDVLMKMVKEEGAEFSPETVAEVTTYLGQALGPDAPPLVDVNKGDTDAFVKVPGITQPMAERLIAQREANGPLATHAEVQAALGLDEAAFAKAKWYLLIAKKRAKK